MKKQIAVKQNIKNDTRIEFRHDIKPLTLPADITRPTSGNAFANREEISTNSNSYLKAVAACFYFQTQNLSRRLNTDFKKTMHFVIKTI